MGQPYVVPPNTFTGTLLPTANTFFLADENAWDEFKAPADRSANPWTVLAGVLGDMRNGNFGSLRNLEKLANDFPYADFADACTIMFGFSAPRRLLEEVVPEETARGLGTVGLSTVDRFRALTLSHTLWGTKRVLQHIDLVKNRSDRREITRRCSTVIDPASPLLEEDDTQLRREGARLLEATGRVIEDLRSDAIVCLNGRPLELANVVGRMMDLIHSQIVADFAHYRVIFEAYTGRDCRHFYLDHRLQKLSAAATLEEFLDSGEAEKYEPGVRYFFGHRIPD